MKKNIDLFLDSGAFTAYTKGTPIDVCDYTKFVLKNKKSINATSALDDIEDWEKGLLNLAISDQHVQTIPCFHYGEPFELLEIFVNAYPYISLGGLVIAGYAKMEPWIEKCFREFCCDENGWPKLKVHGFAITHQRLMFNYPWYSVDSSTWIRVSRMGILLFPRVIRGTTRWDRQPIRISVSTNGPMKNSADSHIDIMSNIQRKKVLDRIYEKGFKLGKSDSDGMIIEEGLCNSYRERDKFNLTYMLELEEQLPEWPFKLKANQKLGFL